jgi:hypothetical protein
MRTSAVNVCRTASSPESEAEGFHVASQPTLPVADGGKKLRETIAVPMEPGPVREFHEYIIPA